MPALCSNLTIKGSYAFTIHGTVFLPGVAPQLLVDGLAKTSFDGNGNLTQLDAVAVNGNVAPGWRRSPGTYSVNPDCTGTFTVSADRATAKIYRLRRRGQIPGEWSTNRK